MVTLSELLRAGGILHDVRGRDKDEVLRHVVPRLPFPREHDRAKFLEALKAREALGSTGIGEGIAIPHARDQDAPHVDHPFITLCLLARPVSFGALDNTPAHAVFVVVDSGDPEHLRILARLGSVLRDGALRALLAERAPADQILGRVESIERTTNLSSAPGP